MSYTITKRGEFGRYLYDLYKRNFSGKISITTKNNIHTLYLKDGRPTFIKEQRTTMPLGRVLVELGMIDNKVYDESLIEMVKTGERQGEILLRKGIITKDQMNQALTAQFYKKAIKLFEICEGEVSIEEDLQLSADGAEGLGCVSVIRLLYNGIKSMNREHISKLLPINTNTTITRRDELDIILFSLPISPEETTIIENIKKDTPYTHLLSLRVATDTEITQIIYFLYLLEVVEISALEITNTGNKPEENAIKQSGIYKPTHSEDTDTAEERAVVAYVNTDEEIRWINELYSKYQMTDYFELFGVETSVSAEKLNYAYQGVLKRLNTIRNAVNIDEETSIKIDQLTYFVEEAYNTLASEKGRKEYQSMINSYYHTSNLDEGMAEMEFIRGEISLMKRDYKSSCESLKKAIEYGGQRPEYIAAYGISLYLNREEPQRSRETLGKLYIKRALQQNPRSLTSYIYYALICSLEGNCSEAEKIIGEGLEILGDNERLKSLLAKIKELFSKKPLSGETPSALRDGRKDSRGEELLRIFLERKI